MELWVEESLVLDYLKESQRIDPEGIQTADQQENQQERQTVDQEETQ